MQLVDRIEARRFVGREFLLWVWFESEVFEATLSTKAHGSFGLWIEGQLVLSAGKEQTRIKGALPAASREAKEALLRGKLPEASGLHLSWGDREATFVFKADRMALSGLRLPSVLGKGEDEAPKLLDEAPGDRRRKGPRGGKRAEPSDEAHEAFYERMHLTREIEAIVEALYRDFITLRLGPAWAGGVFGALAAWASREGVVDVEAYRALRRAHLRRG